MSRLVLEHFTARTPRRTARTPRANFPAARTKDTAANSEARSDSSYGVLRMTLRDGSYDWQFQNTGGTAFTDAGTDTCH